MVNIRKFNPQLLNQPGVLYCGRGKSPEQPGLGNPFSHHKSSKGALYEVQTLSESIEMYLLWLIELLKANQQQKLSNLEHWERRYLKRLKKLASDIKSRKVTDLVCFCIEQENYQTRQPGLLKNYRCHVQILLDAILLEAI